MQKYFCFFTLFLFALPMFAEPAFSPAWMSEQAAQVILRDVGLDAQTIPRVQIAAPQRLKDGSDLVVVTLETEKVPAFSLHLRGPRHFMQATGPTFMGLFVVGGFFTGADSTALLGSIPQTVTVGFSYPYPLEKMKDDGAKLLQTFRLTAPQIALGLKWFAGQRWLLPQRFMVMGVSLGGLFLPTAQRLAQQLQVSISHTIFAFTGSNLPLILENNLRSHIPESLLNPLNLLVTTANVFNNPQWHLPFLQGQFLVITADQDQIIPLRASEELFALLPGKKARVLLHGGHINVDQPVLIEQTRQAIIQWLGRQP